MYSESFTPSLLNFDTYLTKNINFWGISLLQPKLDNVQTVM